MGDRLRPARAEERSNSFNHLTADIDGTTPHCVHTWSPYQDAVPLLMVHDCHFRMCGCSASSRCRRSRRPAGRRCSRRRHPHQRHEPDPARATDGRLDRGRAAPMPSNGKPAK
ncbi:epoxide hydrolase N-terminal domain-containing protein [Streptomyces mexicanus]|uniref:epoxide hydrolase N-terminal domain-containing protein n=1 Tax=Streptomyces mexicanus TaxID=178566 RepID=UPI00363E7C96